MKDNEYMVFTDKGESIGAGTTKARANEFLMWLQEAKERLEEYMPDSDYREVKSLHVGLAV